MAKKHPYKHTHITHHDDGSHTVHHHHESGDDKDHKDYAVSDHDGMMDGMMHHTSEPDEEEEMAEGGMHGVPDDIAMKAGLAGPRPTGA